MDDIKRRAGHRAMNSWYKFESGPPDALYTTVMPWTVREVVRTIYALSRDPYTAWVVKSGRLSSLHGAMLMLAESRAFDAVALDPCDGTGRAVRMGAIRALLDAQRGQ
jgi:hypothetical protein